jgi:predicted lipoprotein with Yx(FWY)xxD motif
MRTALGRFLAPVALVALGAGLAACGSKSTPPASSVPSSTPSSTPPSSTASSVPPSSASAVAVKIESSKYGKVLATGTGRTLYILSSDTPTKSACTGGCLSFWPPLLVTKVPKFGPGLSATHFGQFKRPSGHQLTYYGHQLYTFSGDKGPGQTHGEGIKSFGGTWTVISVSGKAVSKSSSSSSGYGGGGY